MEKNESTELLIQIPLSPERAIAIFEGADKIGELIDTITTEARARAGTVDATTEKGRAALVSLAYTVARTKTTIDDLGKSQVEGIKKAAKVIDDSRKIARDRLDALRDEIRKPVTEFENREKARVENHRRSLTGLEALGVIHVGTSLVELNRRAESLAAFDTAAMEEFVERAKELKEIGIARVRAAIEAMEAAMVQEQEAKRLREENAALLAEKARLEAAAAAAAPESNPLNPRDFIDADDGSARAYLSRADLSRAYPGLYGSVAPGDLLRTIPPAPGRLCEGDFSVEMPDGSIRAFADAITMGHDAAAEGGEYQVSVNGSVVTQEKIAEKPTDSALADLKRTRNREAFLAVNARVCNEHISKTILTAIIRGEIPHVSMNYDQ